MEIKPTLLKINAYNSVVHFLTIYTQVWDSTFIQGVAVHFPIALVCVTILLIELFKSQLAPATQGWLSHPKSIIAEEQRESEIMQVTFPNLLPSFLVKAPTKMNFKHSKSAVTYTISVTDLLILAIFTPHYWTEGYFIFCFHPTSYPVSPNPHLHSCQSRQSTGSFLSLDYYSQLHPAVPLSAFRGTHIYTSTSTHKHTLRGLWGCLWNDQKRRTRSIFVQEYTT